MRARFADATVSGGEPCRIQIVLEVENDEEALLLREFGKYLQQDGARLVPHGFGFEMDKAGRRNFNFGIKTLPQDSPLDAQP